MDISRTDLPLLLSLDMLIEERNVSRAAARLGISQPALSAQLARLRDIFGDPLLVQSGRRMVPTARADELRAPLHRLLSELGALVRAGIAFDPATSDRVFHIAAPDFLHAAVTSRMINDVAKVAPDVRIAMVPATDAWSGMEQDRIDLLVTSIGTTPKEAVAQKLFDEHFVMVQRKGHPRGANPPDIDEFCDLSHVLIALSEAAFRGPVDDTLKAMSRKRRVAVSVSGFLIAPQVIAQTDYVAIVPQTVAALFDHQLDAMEPPFPQPGFPVAMSYHPRRKADAGLAWLRQQIKQCLCVAE
jgi:DNA-binding transcriptional LysR family regulator